MAFGQQNCLHSENEFHADAHAVVRRPSELRLITLMPTLAKTLARQADAALSKVAAMSVAAPQRGFLAGRSIDENMFELYGTFVEFSITGCDAAIMLLDSQAAFPSLDRRFMFALLRRMGIPGPRVLLILALYADLVTDVDFAGQTVGELPMKAGSKQGCPLSGTLFALTLDPLTRHDLATITMRKPRLCALAGDIGMALARLVAQLGPVFAMFERWANARALRLNPGKCIFIPAGDVDVARRVLEDFPAYAAMPVQKHGKYLGVAVGPEAAAHKWAQLVSDSLYVQLLCHAFASVQGTVRGCHRGGPRGVPQEHTAHHQGPLAESSQRSDVSPVALGLPNYVRDLRLRVEAMLAMAGPPQKSTDIQDIWRSIDRATRHEDAMLRPWKEWHSATSVLTGRRVFDDMRFNHPVAAAAVQHGRPTAEERWAIVQVALTRRARRWADPPGPAS